MLAQQHAERVTELKSFDGAVDYVASVPDVNFGKSVFGKSYQQFCTSQKVAKKCLPKKFTVNTRKPTLMLDLEFYSRIKKIENKIKKMFQKESFEPFSLF